MDRRFRAVLVVGLVLAVGAASPAQAQEKGWSGFVGFGGSFPVSDSADNFRNGFNFMGGAAWNPAEKVALQLDYSYNRYGLKGEIFQVTDLGGSHTQQNIFLNFVFFTSSMDETSLLPARRRGGHPPQRGDHAVCRVGPGVLL